MLQWLNIRIDLLRLKITTTMLMHQRTRLYATCQYPSDKLFSPLAFWSDNAQQFPKLAHIARCSFCYPPASSASETALSNAGAVYSK